VYHQNMTRTYQLKRRAESQNRTRQKIIEAAIELHQAKGLSATSMRDIAKRAKVGTVTVYRHFPDEVALVGACSGTYFERNPFPNPEDWCGITDPRERLRRGLRDTYAYHRVTEPMIAQVIDEARDQPVMTPYHTHWRRAADVLLAAWPPEARRNKKLTAAVALALSFDTWRLLVRERGLTDKQAVELMLRLITD
jgi:AcrR family transcriptional regulator